MVLLLANIVSWLRSSSRPAQSHGGFLYYPQSMPERVAASCIVAVIAISTLASIAASESATAARVAGFTSPYAAFLALALHQVYNLWRRQSAQPARRCRKRMILSLVRR